MAQTKVKSELIDGGLGTDTLYVGSNNDWNGGAPNFVDSAILNIEHLNLLPTRNAREDRFDPTISNWDRKNYINECLIVFNDLNLNELELANYNTSFKLSPPLRSEKDREAIIQGIKDGVIDIITSNHQPMSNDTKLLPFSSASIGATVVLLTD